MRIAVGGLHTECSTYNPVLATEADFRVLRGEGLASDPYFAWLREYDGNFLPTLHARAIAGGPVARKTYDVFKAELLERFAALGNLDGIYLAMHGAMYVEGMEDAEGDFISAVRKLVGPDCRIAASYDLHGNLSQSIIDSLDMFSAYRTAPHIDVEETMRRAVAMLTRSLATSIKPHLVWAPVPVVLSGERTSTEDEPAKCLYARLPEIDAVDGIWDASLMVGSVWADEPRATAAAVMTGTNLPALEAAAKSLAQSYWDERRNFAFGTETGTVEECVARALAGPSRPAIIAESGDNPTGGGVGDRAGVLAALVAAGAKDAIFAGIADKPATDAAYQAGVDARLQKLSIGATLDRSSVTAVVDAEVVFLLPTDDPMLREAVLRIDGVSLVVTARRRPFHCIADFARLGLDVTAAKILVVKSGYLSPELAPLANPGLMVLSAGAVDQFVERLPRLRKQRRTFPFDSEFSWSPEVFGRCPAS
jgi:microcystin degradation protein MlrC